MGITLITLPLWPSVLMGAASSQVLGMQLRGFGMLRLTRLWISTFLLKNVLVAFVHSVQVLIFFVVCETSAGSLGCSFVQEERTRCTFTHLFFASTDAFDREISTCACVVSR